MNILRRWSFSVRVLAVKDIFLNFVYQLYNNIVPLLNLKSRMNDGAELKEKEGRGKKGNLITYG